MQECTLTWGDYVRRLALVVTGEVEAADLALQYIILVGEKNNACKECIMLLVEVFTHLHEYSQGFLI